MNSNDPDHASNEDPRGSFLSPKRKRIMSPVGFKSNGDIGNDTHVTKHHRDTILEDGSVAQNHSIVIKDPNLTFNNSNNITTLAGDESLHSPGTISFIRRPDVSIQYVHGREHSRNDKLGDSQKGRKFDRDDSCSNCSASSTEDDFDGDVEADEAHIDNRWVLRSRDKRNGIFGEAKEELESKAMIGNPAVAEKDGDIDLVGTDSDFCCVAGRMSSLSVGKRRNKGSTSSRGRRSSPSSPTSSQNSSLNSVVSPGRQNHFLPKKTVGEAEASIVRDVGASNVLRHSSDNLIFRREKESSPTVAKRNDLLLNSFFKQQGSAAAGKDTTRNTAHVTRMADDETKVGASSNVSAEEVEVPVADVVHRLHQSHYDERESSSPGLSGIDTCISRRRQGSVTNSSNLLVGDMVDTSHNNSSSSGGGSSSVNYTFIGNYRSVDNSSVNHSDTDLMYSAHKNDASYRSIAAVRDDGPQHSMSATSSSGAAIQSHNVLPDARYGEPTTATTTTTMKAMRDQQQQQQEQQDDAAEEAYGTYGSPVANTTRRGGQHTISSLAGPSAPVGVLGDLGTPVTEVGSPSVLHGIGDLEADMPGEGEEGGFYQYEEADDAEVALISSSQEQQQRQQQHLHLRRRQQAEGELEEECDEEDYDHTGYHLFAQKFMESPTHDDAPNPSDDAHHFGISSRLNSPLPLHPSNPASNSALTGVSTFRSSPIPLVAAVQQQICTGGGVHTGTGCSASRSPPPRHAVVLTGNGGLRCSNDLQEEYAASSSPQAQRHILYRSNSSSSNIADNSSDIDLIHHDDTNDSNSNILERRAASRSRSSSFSVCRPLPDQSAFDGGGTSDASRSYGGNTSSSSLYAAGIGVEADCTAAPAGVVIGAAKPTIGGGGGGGGGFGSDARPGEVLAPMAVLESARKQRPASYHHSSRPSQMSPVCPPTPLRNIPWGGDDDDDEANDDTSIGVSEQCSGPQPTNHHHHSAISRPLFSSSTSFVSPRSSDNLLAEEGVADRRDGDGRQSGPAGAGGLLNHSEPSGRAFSGGTLLHASSNSSKGSSTGSLGFVLSLPTSGAPGSGGSTSSDELAMPMRSMSRSSSSSSQNITAAFTSGSGPLHSYRTKGGGGGPMLFRQTSLTDNKVLLAQSEGDSLHSICFHRDFVEQGLLGSGTFADVYKAKMRCSNHSNGIDATNDSGVDEDAVYAVKKSKRQFRSKRDRDWLLEEVRTMKKLGDVSFTNSNAAAASASSSEGVGTGAKHQCPYIVPFVRAWQEESYFYVQMGYAARGTLRELMVHLSTTGSGSSNSNNSMDDDGATAAEDDPIVPDDTVWRIVHDVSAGLSHIHSCGFVHLDIKPANLLITGQGTIQIGDFGMAAAIGSHEDGHEGDTKYMADELLNNTERLPSADIFSLGLTLYEICCFFREDQDHHHHHRSSNSSSQQQQQHSQQTSTPAASAGAGAGSTYSGLRLSLRRSLPTEGTLWHTLREGRAPPPPPSRAPALCLLVEGAMLPLPSDRPSAEHLLAHPLAQAAGARECDAVLLSAPKPADARPPFLSLSMSMQHAAFNPPPTTTAAAAATTTSISSTSMNSSTGLGQPVVDMTSYGHGASLTGCNSYTNLTGRGNASESAANPLWQQQQSIPLISRRGRKSKLSIEGHGTGDGGGGGDGGSSSSSSAKGTALSLDLPLFSTSNSAYPNGEGDEDDEDEEERFEDGGGVGGTGGGGLREEIDYAALGERAFTPHFATNSSQHFSPH